MTSKVDSDGLRTHCPDGHRLVWSPLERDGSRVRRMGANDGICTDGLHWNQDWSYANPRRTPGLRPNSLSSNGIIRVKFGQRDGQAILEDSTIRCAEVQWDSYLDHNEWKSVLPETYFQTDNLDIQSLTELQNVIQILTQHGWSFDGHRVLCPACVNQLTAQDKAIAEAREQELV